MFYDTEWMISITNIVIHSAILLLMGGIILKTNYHKTTQGPNFENHWATVSSSPHYLNFVYKLEMFQCYLICRTWTHQMFMCCYLNSPAGRAASHHHYRGLDDGVSAIIRLLGDSRGHLGWGVSCGWQTRRWYTCYTCRFILTEGCGVFFQSRCMVP